MNGTTCAGNALLFDELPDVLTPTEVATVLRASIFTVYELLRQGKLHGVRVGRKWKIKKDTLLAFLQ